MHVAYVAPGLGLHPTKSGGGRRALRTISHQDLEQVTGGVNMKKVAATTIAVVVVVGIGAALLF